MVQRAMRGAAPMEVMADLGFGEVHLVDSFAVSMSGALSCVYTLTTDICCNQGPLSFKSDERASGDSAVPSSWYCAQLEGHLQASATECCPLLHEASGKPHRLPLS